MPCNHHCFKSERCEQAALQYIASERTAAWQRTHLMGMVLFLTVTYSQGRRLTDGTAGLISRMVLMVLVVLLVLIDVWDGFGSLRDGSGYLTSLLA